MSRRPNALLVGWATLVAALAIGAASADAQEAEPPPRAPVVLVLDSGPVRVNAERLRRTLAEALGRPVVRITDPAARDAAGTLTVAAGTSTRWLVRYEARGRNAAETCTIERPGAISAELAAVATRVVAQLDTPAPAPPPSPDFVYVLWDDEILDPFVGLPPPPRREVLLVSEVIDPFAPIPFRERDPWVEVIDPWHGEAPR